MSLTDGYTDVPAGKIAAVVTYFTVSRIDVDGFSTNPVSPVPAETT